MARRGAHRRWCACALPAARCQRVEMPGGARNAMVQSAAAKSSAVIAMEKRLIVALVRAWGGATGGWLPPYPSGY